MDTSPGKTKVSIVTYSSGVYNQFFLKSDPTRNEIMQIPFRGGRTYTADAIRYVTQTSFNPVHGARNNVPHIAVLVTNGPSSSKQVTKIEAQSAKDNNIIMYTVGVGSSVDKDELQSVSSDPDSRYFIPTQNYGALGSVSGTLASKLCNELPSTSASLPAPTSCLQKADLAFLIDSSTSVGPGNFQKMENFLKQSISKLDLGPDKVHVGLMQYSSYPNMEFPLNMYTDRIDALKAIENIHYMSGGTNTADAIKYMREQMFSLNSGARGNVPRIAIVVTDGGSINGAATTFQADQAKTTNNIGLLAVGVGNNVNANELNSIASSPASQNVITVSSYDQLDQIVDQLLAKTCSITPTVQPMVTAAPGGTLPPDTCVDKVTNCASYGKKVCTNYGPWANDNCARYCGVCQPMYTTPVAACKDSLATCSSYGLSACTQYPEWASANCQHFCGLCTGTLSSSGFYGKCSYKGQAYQTGAKWSDACDYDCICEDGNTGRYKCFNKCPLYHGLPKDCTLIKKDGECCLQPVCNFHQTIQKFESTGKGQTASGIKVCVSGGKQYFQGQTWEDGCSKQCVCANATEGLYTCDAICPSYNNIPSNCHLDQKPGDCCQKPICEYDQQHGSFTGSGTVSGQGIGASPTTPTPCVDRINTCAQYGKDVCTNFHGWATDNCGKFCGICGGEPTPNPQDKCVYKGQSYGQGQSWTIGCDTQCTCENAVYGYYRCDNTCPTYNNLPTGCYESKHGTDCCTTVRCDTGNFIGSTTDPNSIGSGGLIHVLNPTGGQQYVSPTQPSGATVAPGAGGTGFVAPTLKGCLFKGQLYVQDQTWEDGCSYSCQCTDSTKGVYSCRPKCPMYKNLPSSCPMETDPNDPCCQAPRCRYDPITGSTFIPIPSFQPAVQYHGLVRPPTTGELYNQKEYTGSVLIFGTNLTPAPPTERANTTGGIGHCVYRGKQYSQGQTWEDGCDYNCVCEDSRSGLYRCIEKCNHFGNLPQPYCYLKQDPSNPCCKIPYCNFPINYVTNTGFISTAKPPSDHCEYKGTQYKQDQTWFDGCASKCTCDDALSGTYRCLSRCADYSSITSNCTMVPDPNDPYCCNIPSCPTTNQTGSASALPTPAPSGFYTGYQGANIGKCVYKGDSYVQGETWSDGCDYNCECVEAGKGHYSCTDKCPKYPSLPSNCRLISDFTNPCCERPVCDGQTGSVVTGVNPVIGGTTAAPNPIPTLAPNAQYCVYENAQYVQGQEWEVGCLYRCRCDDASRGIYVCNERCPKYDNLGSECSLVADMNDACCLAPRCIFPPLTGNATGSFTPDQIPTAAPGVISGSINIPTPAPVPGGSTVAPPLLTWCEYKGARYSQGQKWYDGCDYQCECVSASAGKFKCVERCRKYLNLPAQCRLVKDPANPCCKTPECDFTGVTQGITNFPKPPVGPTIGPPGPGVGPTMAPNPNSNPTPAPTPKDTCVYKGKNYNEGQQWYDGCDYVCYCEDGSAGVYRCSERCAAFPNIPASCKLVSDPKDPFCCEVPECSFTPTNGTFSGYGYPTAAPGVITGGSVVKPTPKPNILPTPQPQPGVSTLAPTPAPSLGPTYKDVCVYKGQQYTQGQKWEDGCDYNCECVNAKTGFYQCSERCSRYVNLPDGCTLQRDYVNPCCMKPYCVLKPTPKPAVTPSLGPGQTPSPNPTASPNPVCMYNGVPFTQGQSWSDGCELKCVCENATTGYFRCNDRCPHYDLTPGCTMITDPRDSCCLRPYCDPRITPTPAPAIPTAPGIPGQIYTPQPGKTFAPSLYPTLPGGIPLMPGMMLTPAPGQTYAPGLYPTLPGGATLVPPFAQTPYPGYTYAPQIPTAPGVPGQMYTPAPGLTYAPNLYPTIPGGKPLMPGMMITPAPGQTYAPGLYPTLPGGATLVPPFAYTPYPVFTPAPIPTAPGVPGQMYTPAPGKTYAPNLYPTIPGGQPLIPGMMLTPSPGQTYAPGLYPTLPGGATLVPPLAYTPQLGYTNAPIPTAPGIPGQTYTPSPGKTYAPYLYPTVPGGETLMPGMMLTPAPGQMYIPGFYPTLPGGATLVPPLAQTPPSLYTAAPIPTAPGIIGQTYTPSPGKTYAPGLYPTVPGGQTLVPGMMLTPQPGQTYAPGLYPTLPGGATLVPPFAYTPKPVYTFAPKIPTAPGIIGQTYTPSPGHTFAPGLYPTVPGGQTLVPGMMLTPQPGKTYAPGLYPTLPGGATLIPPLMYTPFPGYTYAPPIPTAPGIPGQTYTPAPGMTYAPNLYPTVPGGQPLVPGMILTPAPGRTYSPLLYPTLPGGATLVPPFAGYTFAPIPTAPGVPGQIYTPAPGKTYAPGLYPTVPGGQTLVPGMILTPQPGETYAPGLYPTLPGGATLVPPLANTPYPGFTYPSPIPTAPGVPGQMYTPAPGKTYAPNLYPTIPGGQPLVPGMILTPQPGQTYAPGLYPTLPGGATLVPPLAKTPQPGYTYAPVPTAPGIPGQTYTPSPGKTYGPNLYPTVPGGETLMPGMMLTPKPGEVYIPGLYPTLPGGITLVPPMIYTPYPGYTNKPPIPTAPGIPGQTYTPSPGKTYSPGLYPTVPGGQTLVPGMMLTPKPGQTYAPGLYPTLPGGATLIPPLMYTPYPGFTYAPPIPTAPGVPGQTYTPAPGLTYAPKLYPTIPGGQTLVPGMILTPLPGQTYAPGAYPTLPGGATLVPPFAGYTFAPIPTAPGVPGQIYTPAPGKTYAPGLYPTVPGGQTLVPGMILTPQPGKTYAPGLYPTLPGGATLVPPLAYTPYPGYTFSPPIPTAPGVPGQIYTPSPGKTYAPGLYPTVPGGQTLVPGMMLTPRPGQTYAPGLYPTLPGGATLIPPFSTTPIPTAPGIPGQTYTPSPGKTFAPGLYPTLPSGVTLVPGMILTPQPGKTFAPNVLPTLPGGVTLVPPLAYTPYPGFTFSPPIPTAPGIPGQTYTPSPGKTYAPGLYPTVPGGQTLVPGMMLTPAPGQTYAPALYPTLPGGATLVPPYAPTPYPGFTFSPPIPTAPGIAGQTYTPSPGKTYAPYLYPTVPGGETLMPGMMLTPEPGVMYQPGLYPTLPGGATLVPPLVSTPYPKYTYAPPVPTAPGIIGQTYTPSPGHTFAPGLYPTVPGGQTLVPGMMLTPQPGQTYAPGLYPTLPGGATLIPPLMYTPFPGYTYAPPIPTAPGIPGQMYTPAPGKTYAPNLYPTVPGGQPLVPGMILTPAPGQTYAPALYPTLPGGSTLVPPFAGYTFAPIPTAPGVPGQIYTPAPGKTYAPYLYPTVPGGIPLVPGMMLTPSPGKTYAPNLYPTLPGGATLVPPLANTPYPGYTYPAPIPTAPGVPGQLYTPAPGKTYAPYLYPTVPGGIPLVPGMMLTPSPGKTYAPNLYPTLPGGATLVPPLANTPYPGYINAPIPTAPGIPGQTYTPSPGKTYAPYLYPTIPGGETLMPGMMLTPQPGVMYQPGLYPTLPGGATLVPPLAYTPYPIFTLVPPTPAVTPSPYPVPTAVPGIFEGKGVNGQGKVCMYEGVAYQQGDKWQDGCAYNCECIDASIGRYRCKEKCPLFLNVPSYCRLVVDPNDACCKVPQCVEPTLRPTPGPQPVPGVSPTPHTGPQTLAPTLKETCVFNGKSYTQGQQWYDGCDRTCVCEDASIGYYRCDDRCAKYPNLPNTCTLTADPKDPDCCKVPQCIPIPGVNGNTVNPSGQPIIVTGVPGVITGSGGTPVPRPYITPVLPPGQTPPTTGAPLPKNECVYKGQAYHQGQKWQDGCDYNCECIDGKMGKYQCTERCPTFPVVPPQCTLQRDTNDYCCYVPHCDFNQTVPTPAPQVSPVPGAANIPSSAFCVYNGLPFKQGQVWEQGCSKQCRCDNALTNYYSCFDRCPSFSNLDPSCVMKTDPNDPCCQIPECLKSPTPAPNMQPTLMPGVTPNPNPYLVPTLPPGKITGSGPQVNPNTGLPQTVGFCEYKGVQYHKGDTWDDGCTYKCECIEETTGTFTCNEKCPRFAKLPSNCFMATDPKDTCCKIPSCPPTAAPGLTPTPAPGQVSLPTLSPYASPTPVPESKEVCIYQGRPYTQGQKWFDGCDKKCTCENGKIGYYTCTDRCPSYTNLTPTCVMVPDPNDPDCCTAPKCDNTNTTNPTGVYGSIVGNGRPPTPAPFLAPTLAPGASPDPNAPSPTPMPKVCVYKGTQYTQGQKWQDGCTYQCECMNADAGRFVCTDRCARYPNLPLSCKLEFDPMDPCCEKPNCTPNAAPTLRPGQTTPNPNDFCVYNGIPYKQGQSWKVGCEKVCRCDDAKIGRINCDDRCPSFPVLTGTCSLVTDPNDDCCQVPQCINTNTTNPNQVIIGVPGTVTNGGHGLAPNPNSGTRNGCVYKGKYYTQGQQWDDGCAYHCTCDDGSAGIYRCTEKCPRYARIPSYCTMVQDPANQCCEKPYCTPRQTPAPQPSLAPGQTPPTVSPLAPPQLINKGCDYNGQVFQQGQLWYDGCSKICMCENGVTNFHRCQDRCAKFDQIGAGCTMVPDSRDPTCCKVPSCPLITPSVPPTPGIYTPVPSPSGVVNGYGKVPTPAPQPTPVPQPGVSTLKPVKITPVPGCLYKGQIYGTGIKWDDGCNYKCECVDGLSGRYQCSQRCQRYDNIPKDKCVLIEDPNDKCCQVPYCDFLNPTPFPNGAPTPRPLMAPSAMPGVSPTPKPNVQPTLGPNGATPANPFLAPVYYPTKSPSLTPSPNGNNPGLIPQQKGFCEYKGVYYTQGQTWTDGCQKVCRCEAPDKGYYQCSSRCPRYSNLNSSCVLKTNPSDACCLAPDCNQYPTPRPDLPPVPGAPSTTPLPIYVPSAVTGSFIGSAQNPNGITGGGINFCVYKGKVYSQGMTWDDGCNYKCTCEDASRGLYKCNDRCPQYYQLPWQCHYEKDPKDSCCQIAKCDFNLSPTPAPSTPAPITVAPTPHGWTGPTVKPLDVCMYIDNTTYTKGQTWDVGCDFRCKCEDPSQNKYNCTARCQVFASLPSVCSLVPDPSDKCCEMPSCGAYQPVTVINGTATPPPNSLNVLPVGTHDVFAGSSWGPGSGTHPVTGKRDKCIYKGQAYSQGQSWNDGCQFVCSCEDAEKGIYRCLSKCPAYPAVPNYCHKVTIPGQCCPSLSCDVPGYGNYNPVPQLVPVIAPTPQPGTSPTPRPTGLPPLIHVIPSTSQGNVTGGLPGGGYPITNNQISGVRNQCIYKNKLYNQGETWDDDCDYTCECIDGRTGYYECKPKCPAYPDLPATCFLIKASGSCCRTPQCTYYGMVVDPVAHPDVGIPVVGQYSGGFTGFKPGINFTQTFPSFNQTRNVCVYKGKIYQQNDQWDDGCDFTCLCDDASTGHYQCNTKCPTFAKVPSYCTFVTKPGDCCKKVQCDPGLLLISTTTPVTQTPTPYPPTPTPDPNSNCVDTIDNCNTYGRAACSQFGDWAKRNCKFYCGLCPAVNATTAPCADKLPNCHSFDYSHCTGIYTVWAKDNCPDYCGLCPGATHYPTTTVTTTTSVPCVDVLPNCQDFVAANFCSDPAYKNWSITNCAKTCGLCSGSAQGPTSTVGSMTSGTGWTLLMKGVAGVPGNLYQLWSGTGTQNPNVPEASYLTAQYPGHYKPDLSNNWNSLCLDRVKVSIYNKGVEKAWIIFNATGSDKMNWFTKDRIIDSSWSDIKTAASHFSMPGDPSDGRQFYASGNSNGCDSTGWMMISTTTSNPCFFESGNKPAFYYAPGQTQARWGFTKGTGDVFAIQGHSTCPTTLVVPTSSGSRNGCTYKGQTYKAGDNWVDDCKYNCTCDDDVTGHYTCNDLCPIYTNLPSSLKLQKVPGQCCPKVVFVFTGTIISFTAPPNMCFYKGNSYGTGETWDDGCDYKCNCLDAATGRYKCTQKCVTWNLPPICHLNDPAPGKCCKTPNCPSFVTINYPPNYQEE